MGGLKVSWHPAAATTTADNTPSNGNGIVVKRNLFNDSWLRQNGSGYVRCSLLRQGMAAGCFPSAALC